MQSSVFTPYFRETSPTTWAAITSAVMQMLWVYLPIYLDPLRKIIRSRLPSHCQGLIFLEATIHISLPFKTSVSLLFVVKKEQIEDRSSVLVGSFDTIPILDISGIYSPDVQTRLKAAAIVHDACTRVGFFYIVNHGIPEEIVESTFDCAKTFFALPFEEKMEVYIDNSPKFRGYTPLYGSGRPSMDGKGRLFSPFSPGILLLVFWTCS